jgi:hypothetical protein
MHALNDATVNAYAQINLARSRLTQFLQLGRQRSPYARIGSDETVWPYPQDNLKDTFGRLGPGCLADP